MIFCRTFVVSLFLSKVIFGANYYLSYSQGNDNNQANSSANPWKTLDKLNSKPLFAGDTVYFKRGDVFPGGILAQYDGSPGYPIVYTSYGVGDLPVISGAVETSKNSWQTWQTRTGYTIFYTVFNVGAVRYLYVDGKPMVLARFPNSGYLPIINSGTDNLQVDPTKLPASITWIAGTNVHVRYNRASIAPRVAVQYNISLRQIKLNSPLPGRGVTSVIGKTKWGLFFNNTLDSLDMPGEWFLDSNSPNQRLYLALPNGDHPSYHAVAVSGEGTAAGFGFQADNRAHLEISRLRFAYHRWTGIGLGTSSNVRISDAEILYPGYKGIEGSGFNVAVSRTLVHGAPTNGIEIKGSSSVTDCRISSSGLVRRFSRDGYFNGNEYAEYWANGILARGNDILIARNQIDSSGYAGIMFQGLNISILSNTIDHSNIDLDDGGGIYGLHPSDNSLIKDNRIFNSIGNVSGVGELASPVTDAHGIYLDDRSQNSLIEKNTIANADAGICLHNTKNHIVRNNIAYWNRSYQILLKRDAIVSENMVGNNVYNNTLVGETGKTLKEKIDPPSLQSVSLGQCSENQRCEETPSSVTCRKDFGCAGNNVYSGVISAPAPATLAVRTFNEIEKYRPGFRQSYFGNEAWYMRNNLPGNSSAIVLVGNQAIPGFLWSSAISSWVPTNGAKNLSNTILPLQ